MGEAISGLILRSLLLALAGTGAAAAAQADRTAPITVSPGPPRIVGPRVPTTDPVVYDSFTGASYVVSAGTPRTFMAGVGTLVSPGAPVDLTAATVYMASTASVAYANVVLNLQLWGGWDGAASPVFSSPFPTQTGALGAITTTANTAIGLSLTFGAPVHVASPGNLGVAVNFQGDSGSGLASTDNLTSLVALGPAQTAGTSAFSGYYRNASGGTDYNFLPTDFFSSGNPNERLVVILHGAFDHSVGGSISGASGPVGLTVTGSHPSSSQTAAFANGAFTFATRLASGSDWSVSVSGPPAGQVCSVANAGGALLTADVANVAVTCTDLYTASAVAPAGHGSITPATQSVPVGGTASVTVVADTGYAVASVSGDTCTLTQSGATSTWTTSALTQDCTITAVFSAFDPVPEILHYRFDETGTTVTNHASAPPAGAAAGTIVGALNQGVASGIGGLAALQGIGQSSDANYVNTGWATNLSGSWTISFFTKDVPPSSTLFYIFGDNSAGFLRCFTNGVAGANNWILRGPFTDVLVSGGATVAPHLITFVYDAAAGTIRAYLDAVLVNTVSQSPFSVSGSGPFKVGGYATSSGLSGKLADFRIYGRALSQGEVNELYQDIPRVIGGTVTGLAGAGLSLRLNGGHDLAIGADGPFQFPIGVDNGSTYSVTVAAQPSSPSQVCSVSNGTGTVAGADITSVAVNCSTLNLSVDDNRAYARYGQAVDYLVTLANVGGTTAESLPIVASTPGTALDLAHAHWQCFGAGSGASCAAVGVGPLSDTVTLPVGRSLNWIVTVPVAPATPDVIAQLDVLASGFLPASDVDTLVIFRHTFDASYSDGTNGTDGASSGASLRLPGTGSEVFTLPPVSSGGIVPVKAWREGDSELRVERVVLGATQYLRLWQRDASGAEHASAWSAAAPGATMAVGVVEAGGRRSAVLEGAASALALPLAP